MNELTPFIYQKGPKPGSSATIHYLLFAFYLIKSLYIDDCLKVTDQVQISIINDPKCYNNVILYNPLFAKMLFMRASLKHGGESTVQGAKQHRYHLQQSRRLAQGHFSKE